MCISEKFKMERKMNIGVAGTGHTRFGKSEKDLGSLMLEATEQALSESGTDISGVDVIYVSNFSSNFTGQCHLPALLSSKLGQGKEITRIESACAAGGLAIKEAAIAIQSGLYKTALVVGVEKMMDASTDEATSILAMSADSEEIKHGATLPSLYALIARRHFQDYKTTEEHLAKIAVKNHENAMHNPLAQFHKKITVEDVLASKVVASPLKLLDCSPVSDGAAAVLLCAGTDCRRYSDDPVYLIGMGHDTEPLSLLSRKDITEMPAVIKAGKKAYAMSGLKAKDIDLAEVHDCFTIAELVQIENLGFCEKGAGKDLIENGSTGLDGDIPVNTSGGLKAKGHPIGASGVSQIVEVAKQLRGDAGKRQVKDAHNALCCNIGGTGSTAMVSIFSRCQR